METCFSQKSHSYHQCKMLHQLHSSFYKHTGKLGWSSTWLRFSQFEPEIMLDGMHGYFMVWYCVWYEHCNDLFNIRNLVSSFPANICWSWRRLQHVFSATILRLPRRLEDVLQRRFEDVLKTSWKTKNCYAEDVLKTSWRHVLKTSWRHVLKTSWRHILKTSWRHYGEKQNTYWGSNKSKYVSNKTIFHKFISGNSKANPKCINYNPIISPFLLFWDSRSISILRIKISDDCFGVVKSAEFKLEIAEKVRQ